MTQSAVIIPAPSRLVSTIVTATAGTITTTPPDVLDISDYQSEKKTSDYKLLHRAENRQKVYSLVWQQCTESMHAKIKAHSHFKTIEQALNGIDLLRIIKLICFNI
jgi:hypothetical protein